MSIGIGDKVFVIDETLEGTVISIHGERVVIACEEGFEYEYLDNQLFKVNDDDSLEHRPKSHALAFDAEEADRSQLKRRIVFKGEKPVFDIHLEELTTSNSITTAHEKLLFQLSFVKEVISEASRKRVRRMVFVHGVGKGKLRDELRLMLKESYPQIEFYDGDYNSFGQGATEIIIHQF